MGAPVEARTWNPFGGHVYGANPSTYDSGTNSSGTTYVGSSSASNSSTAPYSQGYSYPFTPVTTAWQPLLPEQMATEARTLADRTGNVDPNDPYAQLLALSRLTQQVEGQLQTLLQQPVDLTAAQGAVTTAQTNQTQFLKQVYSGLSPEQQQQLYSLSTAAEQAQGPQQQSALVNFNQALDAVLTPEQRTTLLGLQRAVEDAQLNLQGQQLVQRILDARAGAAVPAAYGRAGGKGSQTLSLAMAEGRAFLALRMQIQADRKVQDVYNLIITPQMRQQLAPLQQELLAATNVLHSNPNATWAQTRFDQAKANFDRVFTSMVNGQDRDVLTNFETYQGAIQNVAATLGEEAGAERDYFQLLYPSNPAPATSGAAADPKALELARTGFNLAQHNRNMRSLAARATTDCNQDLHKQAQEALVQSLRMTADFNVMRAQYNYDQTLVQGPPSQSEGGSAPGGMTLVSYSTAAAGATTGAPASQPTIAAAKQLLDEAQQAQKETYLALTPPPPPQKKSGWDYALDIGVGVGEIIGGVALGIMTGWSGVGLVASIAIIADGSVRLGHSISDAVNGTVTDAPISAGLQKLGMSRNWANRTDVGINFVATVPVAITGATLTAVRATSLLVKGVNVLGGVLVADGGQAQVRSVLSGDQITPFSVQGLTSAGLTPTQANYVLMGGSMIAVGGITKAASARAFTGRTELAFKEFKAADPSQPARVADWYSRGAPRDVRKAIAADALGPDASNRAISRGAATYRGKTLVVIREGSADTAPGEGIVGTAVLKRDYRGSFGRDPLGNKVGKQTTQIVRVAGDDMGRQQAIAASVVGTEYFTRQQALSWYTTSATDSRRAPGAVVVNRRVRRDAVQTFEQIPAAQRPANVNAALNSSLSNEGQLRALAKISTNDRYSWPDGAQDLHYQRTFKRPPVALGSEFLGKILHPMHRDSYVSRASRGLNPTRHAINLWEKFHPRMQLLQTFPAENGRPAMVAVVNKPHSLNESVLYQVASKRVEGHPTLASATDGVNQTMETLRGQHVVTVWDTDGNLVAGGALSRTLDESSGTLTPGSQRRAPAGTHYLNNGFSTSLGGWLPLWNAADTLAGQRGARYLVLDPTMRETLLPTGYELPRAQAFGWGAFNLAHKGFGVLRQAGASAKNAVTNVVSPVTAPITSVGRQVLSGVNPYSYPKGVAPDALRSGLQKLGYVVPYVANEVTQTGVGAVRVSLVPQILTGNAHLVTNDDRTVLPFNGLPGSPSVGVYFSWTGTLVTLWGNGTNLRGPMPLDNGLPPLLRVRPALHDPHGPNSAGVLGTARLIIVGEVNLGIRYFGSNNGVSAQSTYSFRVGRANSNVRGDMPIQSGGPKGLSLIGSLTAFAPSTSHAIYFGPMGVTFRTPRVTMVGTAQTSALESAAQASGYRVGSHYTLGAKDVSGGSGFYLTINPAYGDPDFRPG